MINWIKSPSKANKTRIKINKVYPREAYNQLDVYRYWKDLQRSNRVVKGITPKIAKAVWKVYNQVLSEMLLEGIVMDLPYGLGSLGIYLMHIKKQAERYYLNCSYYKQTGEGVEILRKSKMLRWGWRKGRGNGPLSYQRKLYSFRCCKDLRIKTNHQDIFAFGNYYNAVKTLTKCKN